MLDRRSALLGLTAAGAAFAPRAFANLYLSPPQSVGFSEAGIAALNNEFHSLVDQQKLAGVVTLLARHGRVVNFDAYGKADAETGKPIARDSIFRIASMTKPVTGLAMMQLWERGRWDMDDPIHRHIPEFRNLRVQTADGRTVAPNHAPTMRELMSHSAGFGRSARYNDLGLQDGNLQDMIDKLADQPLYFQPGTDWEYGPSVNIQSYIVEKLSGMDLAEYMQRNIFTPLEMSDTQFWVEPSKEGRVVRIHTYDDGKIVAGPPNVVRTEKPEFLSGSGGLLSTAEDYWRFAQATLNGGELNGARVLRQPDTVRVMRTNVLKPGVTVDLYGPSMNGIGFGMDYAIVMDPAAAGTPQGLNSFYWGGAFGTWFWIDPTNDLVFVGMIQNASGSTPTGGTPPMREISPRLTYAALTDRSA